MKEAEEYLELFMDLLKKNKRVFVSNMGSGMRMLIGKNDIIGVSRVCKKELNLGDIILYLSTKMIMGGRIIKYDSADKLRLKSDCGRGKSYEIPDDAIVGRVDFMEITGKLYPIRFDKKTQVFHKTIAEASIKVLPRPGWDLFRSGRWISLCLRKFWLSRVRKEQRKLRIYIEKHAVEFALSGGNTEKLDNIHSNRMSF